MASKVSYSFAKTTDYYQNRRDDMLGYIPDSSRKVLEFGCGDGSFSESIMNSRNAQCWGVEIDANAAAEASAKLHKVINADAIESLSDLPDVYFDCIVFNDTLEHLVDPFSLLKMVKTKLTSSGVVVASIPNVRFWNNLRDLVLRGDWDYKDGGILDSTHLRFFTYKSLVKLFHALQYEIVTIEGLRPTKNKKFRIVNFLLCNKLWDAKYHQFACVVRPSG